MHKIIALWAIPRSTSTAFEWMMRQRGDLDCLHEPFGEAWYQGEEPLWQRFREGDKTTPGLTLESVWQDLQQRAAQSPVFIKDFPHYINHLWDAEFLSHFTHAFLIRDPAKTITSMFNKWPDFDEGEVGFPEQRALFDLLHAISGTPPPVIDSDDLLENPHEVTKAFCQAVGLPFLEEALTWEPGGDPSEHSWWDGGSFHHNLAQSTGLVPQARRYVELDKTPLRVQQVHRRMKPHYDHLYQYRLTVDCMTTSKARQPQSIAEVVESGLCIGCGLCQAIAPDEFKMVITKQGCCRPFPLQQTTLSDAQILTACPGAVAKAQSDSSAHHDSVWGGFTSLSRAWAGDEQVRYRAATGGVLTAMGLWLLSTKRAHFILHCGADPEKPMRSRWVLSESPQQVLDNAGSRYGPSDTLAGLEAALAREQAFAIIAKPCDAGAVRARAQSDPRLNRYLIAVLVVVCGGASDLGKSESVLESFNLTEGDITLFRYRGYGNPGPTRIETKQGTVHEQTYQQMWADESGWRIQSRCKLCPDPNGEAADLAASDIWPNANPVGEDEGFNGVICRTRSGQQLFEQALADGVLKSDLALSPRDFDHFQPHQVAKKKAMAARLRGLSRAGLAHYQHQGLRIDELDANDAKEEYGAYQRALDGRFSEAWPPDVRGSETRKP